MKTVVILLLAATMPMQVAADDRNAEPYTDPEVYAIYSRVIEFLNRYEFQNESKVFIDKLTVTYQTICGHPSEQHQEVAPALVGYERANQVRRELLPWLKLDKPYELVSADSTSPSVRVDLSNVGFNADKTVAVVTWRIVHPKGTSSRGDFVLHKVNDTWQQFAWSDVGCFRPEDSDLTLQVSGGGSCRCYGGLPTGVISPYRK